MAGRFKMKHRDNMEKVLRELHVLLSKSNPYERDSNYLVVNKKEMLDVLKQACSLHVRSYG